MKYFVTGPKFSQSLEMNVSAIFLKENMSKATQDKKSFLSTASFWSIGKSEWNALGTHTSLTARVTLQVAANLISVQQIPVAYSVQESSVFSVPWNHDSVFSTPIHSFLSMSSLASSSSAA